MVLGYHVIITTYGFWLPNDPRGSWSDFVGAWELFRFGHATKVSTRRSLAGVPHDREKRQWAKRSLKYPEVHFDGRQALDLAKAFGDYSRKHHVDIWACAILPQHVHLVIGRHYKKIERIINGLKGEATRRLRDNGRHPFAEFADEDGKLPKMWTRGEWKVYLDSRKGIEHAIEYVEQNPEKEGKRRQVWAFVTRLPER